MLDKTIVSRVETILYDDRNDQKIIIESTCHKKRTESCESVKSEPTQTRGTCCNSNDIESNDSSIHDQRNKRQDDYENNTASQNESRYTSCKSHSEEYINEPCNRICNCNCNCPCNRISYTNTTNSNAGYNYQTWQQYPSKPCSCSCHTTSANQNYYNNTQTYTTSCDKQGQSCHGATNNVCMPNSVPVITYSHSPAMIVSPVSVAYVQPQTLPNTPNTMYTNPNYKVSQNQSSYASVAQKPYMNQGPTRIAYQSPQNINHVIPNPMPTYAPAVSGHYVQQVSNSYARHPYVSTISPVSSAMTANQTASASGLSITIPMSSEKADGKTRSKGFVELDIPGYGKYNVPFKLKAKKKH